MTEERARERLIERARALPYREPPVKPDAVTYVEIIAHNDRRMKALTEIGDYNRAHPSDAIRPEEIA